MNDLVIRNAFLVGKDGVRKADLSVIGGCIASINRSTVESARSELDAEGCYLFPGFIDAHVHFNEPGRTDWEGLDTGSRALAAGGGTMFFDMPLNSHPPVLSREALEEKRRIAEQKSVLDFALWGGLCPGHVESMDEMAEAGAIGFKAFMCPSGIDEFPFADGHALREGMIRAKRWNLPVAVHAEDPATLSRGRVSDRTFASYLASRPKAAEVEAIRIACELAGETGAALHVVHVSCREGIEQIALAKSRGANVSAETCPHYLLFNSGAALRIGARAKCSPPLREQADVEGLWDSLWRGGVNTIGSDHSPAPPSKKMDDDYFEIWGGISGCQHAFAGLASDLRRRDPQGLPLLAGLVANNVAERFRLPGKGRIEVGSDADFTLLRFGAPAWVRAEDLLYRHPMSLYEGLELRCTVECVFLRGQIVGASPERRGKFVRPSP